QEWVVVVALYAVVSVTTCSSLNYNSNGSPVMEIINTGVPGQSPQGRFSWQTPEDSSVWVQYPVNPQGFVPWTPAEFSYSVAWNPIKQISPVLAQYQPVPPTMQIVNPQYNQAQATRSGRKIEPQVLKNNYQSIPKDDKNGIIFKDVTKPPITESNKISISDTTTENTIYSTSETPQYTLPFTTTTMRPITMSTITKKEPELIEIQTETPIEVDTVAIEEPVEAYTEQPFEGVLPTTIPIVAMTEIETTDTRGYVADMLHILPKLIGDLSPRQITTRQPIFRINAAGNRQRESLVEVNTEIRNKQRRPGGESHRHTNSRRPEFRINSAENIQRESPVDDITEIKNKLGRSGGIRFRPARRRYPSTNNNIATPDIEPVEISNKDNIKRPSLLSRLRNPGSRRNPVTKQPSSATTEDEPTYAEVLTVNPVEVDTDIINRPRRPGLRFRQTTRRNPSTKNNIATPDIEPVEVSNKDNIKRASLLSRLGSQGTRQYPVIKQPTSTTVEDEPAHAEILTANPVEENTEITNKLRRPGGIRFRPARRRYPSTDNGIATVDEESSRGNSRRRPMPFRLKRQGREEKPLSQENTRGPKFIVNNENMQRENPIEVDTEIKYR
ncbi:unnamed protein product, partial [Meganyctiphanes norvegica]